MDLFSRFMYNLNQNFGITPLLYSLPGIILALTIHEYAHALAAYLMGDKTAKQYGRLTLNPIAHMDPLGFLCLIVTRQFGWAKPVPVNDLNFKNRRRGMLIVSLAGPVSNFTAALLIAIAYPLLYDSMGEAMRNILQIAYMINLGIGVFNLIPIPPLDGSKVLESFLSSKQLFFMRRYAMYSNVIMIMLIFSGIIGIILGPIIGVLNFLINSIVRLII